jgi:Kef-type K+ transport system membrane component KefB
VHRFSSPRLATAIVLLALIAIATEVDAIVTLAVLAALLAGVIAYETVRFAELRDRMRHQLAD